MRCQGQDDHAAIAGVALVPCALMCVGLVCLSVATSFTHKAVLAHSQHTQATRPECKGRAVMRGQTTKPIHESIAADHFTRSHTTVHLGAHPRPSLPLTAKLCRQVVVVKDRTREGCKKGAVIRICGSSRKVLHIQKAAHATRTTRLPQPSTTAAPALFPRPTTSPHRLASSTVQRAQGSSSHCAHRGIERPRLQQPNNNKRDSTANIIMTYSSALVARTVAAAMVRLSHTPSNDAHLP